MKNNKGKKRDSQVVIVARFFIAGNILKSRKGTVTNYQHKLERQARMNTESREVKECRQLLEVGEE